MKACASPVVNRHPERGRERGSPERVARRRILRLAAVGAAERPGLTIAVSNEVGMGVVPATPLGRVYRDLLGSVNATWAEVAEEVSLVVAGRVLALASPDTP